MASMFAAIFMFALGVAVVLAGMQVLFMATVQDTRLKLYGCVLLGILCIAGGITLACVPWSIA